VHRLLRILSTALITAGLVILADVATTLLWREPISSVYAQIKQNQAEKELAELESRFPTKADLRAARRSPDPVGFLAARFAKEVHLGDAIGKILIPKINLDTVVVQGTRTQDLEKGPGHYPKTAFPGQGKTVAFAGHRTTYLAPFRHLDSLKKGDDVILEMPYANFTYRVQKTKIVDPSDVQIIHNTGYERLVLTACNPLYSAAQRIAAFARLKSVSFFAIGNRIWEDP
jgi:sortase A